MEREARPYHHGDLRRATVEAAVALVEERGREALSLREVARRLGVSHAAPYRHFATRDDLLDAVGAEGFARLEALVVPEARYDRPASAAITALAYAYVDFALAHPHLFRLMLGPEGTDACERKAAAERSLGVLVGTIARGQARGELRPGDPEGAALAVWGLAHGLAQLAVDGHVKGLGPTGPADPALAAVVASAVGVMLQGMELGSSEREASGGRR